MPKNKTVKSDLSAQIAQSSYKDPSGFIFHVKDNLFRQVNLVYKDNYDLLMKSGLYDNLVSNDQLIRHNEVLNTKSPKPGICYKIIKPEHIDFFSYPYEWSYSMLKDAALLTLDIQKKALSYNLSLKDASSYNVTFYHGKPIFIDTLSFEQYQQGSPWVAYRQFCQHFLGPLALASYKSLYFIPMLRDFLDGYPLDFISCLLPKKTILNLNILLHLHAHAKSSTKMADNKVSVKNKPKISKIALLRLIDSLFNTVANLNLPKISTQWGDYYDKTNYTEVAFNDKKNMILGFLSKINNNINAKSAIMLDLGANNGEFSKLAGKNYKLIIASDIDPLAIEQNYQMIKINQDKNVLPLLLDLANPSPDLGFNLCERESILKRIKGTDVVLALALIHHLAITYNLPFEKVAGLLSNIGKYLIIEFIPKDDSQVQILLKNREDVFIDYDINYFEKIFGNYYQIIENKQINTSKRTIYLMKSKNA